MSTHQSSYALYILICYPRSSNSSSQGLSTGTTVALVFAGLIAFAVISSLLVCAYIRRYRMRDHKPSIVEPGLTAGAYFKDFTGTMSSRHHQSRHKHEMSIFAHPTEQDKDISNVANDSEALITASRRSAFVDPASPTPYLRVSNTSSHKQTYQTSPESEENVEENWEDSQQGQHAPGGEKLRRDTLNENKRNSRAGSHKSGKRSVSVDPPRLPRLNIPSPNYGNATLTSPVESAKLDPISRLLSHSSRGVRRISRRSSFGVGHRYSMLDTPSSVSTMRFGLPESEESGGIVPGRSALLPSPSKGRAVGGSVEQSGTQKTPRPLASLQKPSNWQPPW